MIYSQVSSFNFPGAISIFDFSNSYLFLLFFFFLCCVFIYTSIIPCFFSIVILFSENGRVAKGCLSSLFGALSGKQSISSILWKVSCFSVPSFFFKKKSETRKARIKYIISSLGAAIFLIILYQVRVAFDFKIKRVSLARIDPLLMRRDEGNSEITTTFYSAYTNLTRGNHSDYYYPCEMFPRVIIKNVKVWSTFLFKSKVWYFAQNIKEIHLINLFWRRHFRITDFRIASISHCINDGINARITCELLEFLMAFLLC